MKISVVMATYNGERWIEDQIKSIALQTLPPDEIIVVDDQSKDGTVAILQRLSHQFPIRLIQNDQNSGSTLSFARGVAAASGDVIFFSDQDDVWVPEKIATLIKAFEDPRVGMAYSRVQNVDQNLTFLPNNDVASHDQAIERGLFYEALLKQNLVAGLTMGFRSQFKPYLLPIPDKRLWHDYWTALIVSTLADVAFVDQRLVLYRQHGKNQVGVKTTTQKIKQWTQAFVKPIRWYRLNIYPLAFERLATLGADATNPKFAALKTVASFCQLRLSLPASRWRRLPILLQALHQGFYHQYSTRGWFSLLQDLLRPL